MSSRRTTAEERAETNPLQFYRTPPWATWVLILFAQIFLRGASVLELGCGDGMIAREILACEKLHLSRYVAVELDEGRAELCRAAIEPLGGEVCNANVLELDARTFATTEASGLFDIIVMNPPFDKAVEFLHVAKRLLRPGGRIYMLQRCTFPNEVTTGRDLLFEHDNEAGRLMGYAGKVTLTNRCDFRGDGKCDSINHSWFEFIPRHAFPARYRTYEIRRRRAPCKWAPERDPEVPRQKWVEPETQVSLF